MRKKKLLIVALLACLTAGLSWYIKDEHFFEPGVTARNFKRLRNGMTEQEIVVILGETGEMCETTIVSQQARYLDDVQQKRLVRNGITIEFLFHHMDEWFVFAGQCTTENGHVIPIAQQSIPLRDLLYIWFGI